MAVVRQQMGHAVGWRRSRVTKDQICRGRSMVPDGRVAACPYCRRRHQGAISPTANGRSAHVRDLPLVLVLGERLILSVPPASLFPTSSPSALYMRKRKRSNDAVRALAVTLLQEYGVERSNRGYSV